MKNFNQISLILLGSLTCFVGRPVSAQLAKPNLSGTWELNLEKSKPLRVHRTGVDRYKIKHSEAQLSIEHTYSSDSETSRYIIDGKMGLPNPGHRDVLAKAYWDGDTLVIEKHQETGQSRITWMSRYTLSQDGQSLAITRHVTENSFSSDLDETLVYEKRK